MSAASLSAWDQLLIHDVFQAGLVGALMTGMYTTIVVFTLHKIVSKHGLKSALQPLVALMILMYICAVVSFARQWTRNTLSFVDRGTSQEDTLRSLLQTSPASSTVLVLSRGLIMLIADYIMIWRCWRLYNKSWFIIALPLCLLAGEIASLTCHVVYMQHRHAVVASSDAMGKIILAHLLFTLLTTVLVTLLIVYRIIRMGGARRYRNIIEMIVESSALYAIATIIYMPFLLSSTMYDIIYKAVLTPLPGIASTLIIARVTLGQGVEHPLDEREIGGDAAPTTEVSTLRFRNTVVGTMDEEVSTGLGANSVLDLELQTSKDNTL